MFGRNGVRFTAMLALALMLAAATAGHGYSRRRWSGAVILWNYTDIAIPYQICSDGESPCFPDRTACKTDPCGSKSPAPCKPCAKPCVVREPDHLCEGVLQPGGWEYHGRTRDGTFSPIHFEPRHRRELHFSVRFDGNLAAGVQHATVHLPHETVEGNRTKPIDGRAYAFIREGPQIRLVKGDHHAVAAVGRPRFDRWAKEWAPPPPPSYREWLWKPTGTVTGGTAPTDPVLGRPTVPRGGSGYPGAYQGMGTQFPGSVNSPFSTEPGPAAGAGPSGIGQPPVSTTPGTGFQPMSGTSAGASPGTAPAGMRPAIPSTTPNP